MLLFIRMTGVFHREKKGKRKKKEREKDIASYFKIEFLSGSTCLNVEFSLGILE